MESFKSIDAYRYIVSGHVKEVLYHCSEEDIPVCFLSAKVTPSQRIKEKPHNPWVCLRYIQSSVHIALACLGNQLLGGVCSHVAAIIFKVAIGMEPMTANKFHGLVGSRSKPVVSIIPKGNNQLLSIQIHEDTQMLLFSCIPPLDGELPPESVDETKHRRGRITGTKAHDVLVIREDTLPDTLVKSIMGFSSFDLIRKPAVKWGINNEQKARHLFISTMSRFIFGCLKSNGLTKCKCCGKGVIEIKSPYKHRESLVSDAAQSDKVQIQMHVHQVQYCDFDVFTSKELCITRLKYDARVFFMSLVLSENVTRELENRIIDAAENDNVATYCICDQQKYGKMIQWDNDDCWFHYACVNVCRKPRGKWYCPCCKDN
ncbi:hypothetical protein ACJMK2_014985 [Sinanodonta woodiana]|uniref:Uncharacterized protein n=1 Tax=Sinanodonta woodiana TaxID=1069815 RepID=A0ABD3V2A5_SINWO